MTFRIYFSLLVIINILPHVILLTRHGLRHAVVFVGMGAGADAGAEGIFAFYNSSVPAGVYFVFLCKLPPFCMLPQKIQSFKHPIGTTSTPSSGRL